MRKLAIFLLLTMVLTACSTKGSAPSAQTNGPVAGDPAADAAVLVEIISLDHSPIRPAVQEVQDVAAEFGDKVTVQAYNFGTPDGDAFAEEHNLEGHTPIAIFVNQKMEYEVDGRSIKFYSFPQGGGTGMVAEGGWSMDDLRAVLEQVTN